ncbi:MAG: S8 family serine peptidase [Bdellovibrionaceae bacterium]|nr:S8 family serine peptidase [Pseudobdellovibrionaceae bacterium]
MKLYLLILISIFITACDNNDDNIQANDFVNKPNNPGCQSAQKEKQFIVVWKDGSVSREYAKDKDDFIKNFMAKNKEYIQLAEHDYVIIHTPVAKGDGLQLASIDNWGAANIRAQDAWQEDARGQGVTVAVIDSGLDIFHNDIKNQIAINKEEIPNNGIDDDKNGYIDDYYGFSFVTGDDDVTQSSLHGTHVSGIIAAEHNDVEIMTDKVQGIAPKAKILPLKFIDSEGGGLVSDAIEAIDYAVSRGAKVINASWGGGCSESLRLKVNQLSQKNVLFIAAAGNSSKDIDVKPEYPAAYTTDSIITVGAITKFNGLAYYSNYGESRVHLFAPGDRIISTTPNNSYESLDGTSMAAPFVSGSAAVLWGDNPTASAQQIKYALLNSVEVEIDGGGNPLYVNATKGRLNLSKALSLLRASLNP